jgi:phosphoglucosamine mutase
MGKLFGTDGIRGVVNRDLDAKLAYRVGMAAAIVMSKLKHGRAKFTIGKDTRISSDMLEAALMAGLCSGRCRCAPLRCRPHARGWPI